MGRAYFFDKARESAIARVFFCFMKRRKRSFLILLSFHFYKREKKSEFCNKSLKEEKIVDEFLSRRILRLNRTKFDVQ